MGFDSSQDEGSLFLISVSNHMDDLHFADSSRFSKWPESSATKISQSIISIIKDEGARITPPPELRLRAAIPEPQNAADCQQASQSASQAIQQATQQASDSIRQASEQASQSAAAASRSASEAIQQAQQSASQSIAAASRSASSAMSSASSVVSSIQSSAADAISKANAGQSSAQASASNAQVEASKAVLQAGAAVAAATGKAAAAGSSFLAAAAQATQSAQASVSAFGAAAASQISQASQQVTASQTTAITATQTAIAIVGSIIASTLITILVYFLITRHRKKANAKRRSRGRKSPGSNTPDGLYDRDAKFSASAQVGTTLAESQSRGTYTRPQTLDPGRGNFSPASFSLFPKISTSEDRQESAKRNSLIKTTSVPWNPLNPPKPPSLGSWLKTQEVSPFGPIKLPTDEKSNGPLGGQLKSPLQSKMSTRKSPISPRFVSNIPLRSPKIPNLSYRPVVESQIPPVRSASINRKPVSPERPKPDPLLNKEMSLPLDYRESKASVWTDDLPAFEPPSPILPSPPGNRPVTVTKEYSMELPLPRNPIRTTAEWLSDQARQQTSPRNSTQSQVPVSKNSQPSLSLGLPRNPRLGRPMKQDRGQSKDIGGEVGYVQRLNPFLAPGGRDSVMSRYPSNRSQMSTPGVGKAM